MIGIDAHINMRTETCKRSRKVVESRNFAYFKISTQLDWKVSVVHTSTVSGHAQSQPACVYVCMWRGDKGCGIRDGEYVVVLTAEESVNELAKYVCVS